MSEGLSRPSANRVSETTLVVQIGIDSEWVTQIDPMTNQPWNDILSYQAFLHFEGQFVSHVIYPAGRGKRRRIRFATLIKRVVDKAVRERVLPRQPDRCEVFAHFLRADLPHFQDFWPRKQEFDGFGRTFTARGFRDVLPDDAELDGDPARRVRSEIVIYWKGRGASRQPSHRIICRFIDTMLLTPGRGSLATAAELIGMKKVDLPPGFRIDRMDLMLKADPAAFERYALTDAEIAVRYGLRMKELARELGLRQLPSTLAAFGIQLLKLQTKANGVDLDDALGIEVKTHQTFHERTRRYRTRKVRSMVFRRQIHEEFGALLYQGGRGESYSFGPTPVGIFFDYDLKGAYTTAMCALRAIDYDGYRQTRDLDDFTVDTVGGARVRFEFPDGTRFPCLPVRINDSKLVFPLQGESLCTGPELVLARSMGAAIEVLDGIVFPYADDHRMFASFTRLVQEKRAEAGKGSFMDKLVKEIGNSVYGKLAQGVHPKRVFDTKSGRYDSMPPSAITSAYLAAYVTGFIRAVLGEILAGVPVDRVVVSATTDGLLTDATPKELQLDGPLCRAFRDLRSIAFGDDDLLEEKHRVAQVVAMKTRGQITGQRILDRPYVLAKAGIKPDVPVNEHNDYMLRLFLDRQPGQSHHQHSLVGLQEMWRAERDLVSLSREIRLNLDFDFKRRPCRPRDEHVRVPVLPATSAGVGASQSLMVMRTCSHLAFDTEPWRTSEEAHQASERFRGWTRSYQRVLKSLPDYHDWLAYETALAGPRVRGVGIRRDGALGHLHRQFLRALVRSAWGLDLDGWTYPEVAARLTERGFETSVNDLKNARRSASSLAPRSVYVDQTTIPLLRVIAELFPGIDLAEMIIPEQLEDALEALNLS